MRAFGGAQRPPESSLARKSTRVVIASIRAKFTNGVLTPLEPLCLEEGREFVVSIEDAPHEAGGKESILEMFEGIRNSVPPDTWDALPTDLVKNKKHYFYGHPKDGT